MYTPPPNIHVWISKAIKAEDHKPLNHFEKLLTKKKRRSGFVRYSAYNFLEALKISAHDFELEIKLADAQIE